jgi:hypothetical protein
MDKMPIIICFYTIDTPYEAIVQKLSSSCEQFGLENCIEGIKSTGSWELNCAYKPFFIYKKLEELKRPVLWVDADGIFKKNPKFLDVFSADFAVRIENCALDHPSKVISSTVYVNYTPPGVRIVKLWAEESHKQLTDAGRKGEFWDQIALRNVLFSSAHQGTVKPLPLSYAKIFDHPGDLAHPEPAVIEHYQASRLYWERTMF